MTLTQYVKSLLGISLNELSQVRENVQVLGNLTGNQTLDLSAGNVITATLTGLGIWTFSNVAPAGKCSTVTLILTNPGAFVITWASVPKWPGGVPPVLSAAGVDVLILTTVDGGTTWYGSSSLAMA